MTDRMSISPNFDGSRPLVFPSWKRIDHKLFGSTTSEEYDIETFKFGRPNITVLKKFPDWSVLLLSRGIGPKSLLQWIAEHAHECFELPDLVYSSDDSDVELPTSQMPLDSNYQHQPQHGSKRSAKLQRQENEQNVDPVLANTPCSLYAKSIVLVAKNREVLKFLITLKITVHCLIKGRHKPMSEITLTNALDGIDCATTAISLDVVPSNTAEFITLVVASNTQTNQIAPRQFRRHFKKAGWPILGNAKDAEPFCGEPLCMSMVQLEFLALGITNKQCICVPSDPKLRIILEREERLWRERRGQIGLQRKLFVEDIPRIPPEYESQTAMFHGLEFRVTPAVMIPKQRSEALVDRVVEFFNKEREQKKEHARFLHRGGRKDHDPSSLLPSRSSSSSNGKYYMSSFQRGKPKILDLGTGSGNILVAILHQLRSMNATGLGLDASREALEIADYNIAALGLRDFATTMQGKFSQVQFIQQRQSRGGEKFNVVVCNPPYYCYNTYDREGNDGEESSSQYSTHISDATSTEDEECLENIPLSTTMLGHPHEIYPLLDISSLAHEPHRAYFVDFDNQRREASNFYGDKYKKNDNIPNNNDDKSCIEHHKHQQQQTSELATITSPVDPLVHYKDVISGLWEGNLCGPGALLVFEVYWGNAQAVADLMIESNIQDVEIGRGSNEYDPYVLVEGRFPESSSTSIAHSGNNNGMVETNNSTTTTTTRNNRTKKRITAKRKYPCPPELPKEIITYDRDEGLEEYDEEKKEIDMMNCSWGEI